MAFSSIEICASVGGQALGLERAGFDHVSLVETKKAACQTLRDNRIQSHLTESDIHHDCADRWSWVDLLACGDPCPPLLKAGEQLRVDDQRELCPEAFQLVEICDSVLGEDGKARSTRCAKPNR